MSMFAPPTGLSTSAISELVYACLLPHTGCVARLWRHSRSRHETIMQSIQIVDYLEEQPTSITQSFTVTSSCGSLATFDKNCHIFVPPDGTVAVYNKTLDVSWTFQLYCPKFSWGLYKGQLDLSFERCVRSLQTKIGEKIHMNAHVSRQEPAGHHVASHVFCIEISKN